MQGGSSTADDAPRTIEDAFNVDGEDDDKFVSDKLAELQLDGSEVSPSPETAETKTDVESERVTVGGGTNHDGKKCMHPNKTPPRHREVKGKKGFWHTCRDCNALIKAVASKSRADYHGAKAPRGTRVSTHKSEDRRRD